MVKELVHLLGIINELDLEKKKEFKILTKEKPRYLSKQPTNWMNAKEFFKEALRQILCGRKVLSEGPYVLKPMAPSSFYHPSGSLSPFSYFRYGMGLLRCLLPPLIARSHFRSLSVVNGVINTPWTTLMMSHQTLWIFSISTVKTIFFFDHSNHIHVFKFMLFWYC